MSNEFIYLNNLEKENRMFRKEIQELHINIVNLENNLKDYKSRIDKTIEYLTDETREFSEDCYYKVCELVETEDLIKILKGEKQDEQN